MYDDGTELYIIFFDRYKMHVKVIPHQPAKVYTYPIIYKKKTSRITSFYSVTLPQDVAPTTQNKTTFFIPLLY